MKLTEAVVKGMVDAAEHALAGNGPTSISLCHARDDKPAAVVFVIPAPVGPLVDTFLNDLYTMLGWHVQRDEWGEVH